MFDLEIGELVQIAFERVYSPLFQHLELGFRELAYILEFLANFGLKICQYCNKRERFQFTCSTSA